MPALARLTPWVSRSEFELGIDCIPENPVCLSDGTAWLAGVLLDGGSRESRLRPYLGAGIGWWRNEAGTGFANGVLFGVAVELIPLLAPVAELRWERYPVLGRQSLASLGLQLTLPRPGGDSGR
ncbi:MAG: hypothetical protein FIB01_00160 [Gemmatimonadetes bacterium]|nr:hypothetical protein [Gemmatimonadota bacterium]